MTSLRRSLPSLDHLEIFEVAGRVGSFSRAAVELGVTQAAVSYAIRALETDLGAALFRRSHTGVALTEAGARFHAEVSLALGHVRRSVDTFRQRGGRAPVTLSVSSAFATWWMLPRLARLRTDLPDVDLRVQTTDKDVDLQAENLSLGVRYGKGLLAHYRAEPLAEEEIFPACSPEFAARLDRHPESAADLTDLRLIHLDEPYRYCPTWSEWFASAGVDFDDHRGGLRFNDYALAVLAALGGQGIVLAWEHLLGPQIAQGTLVRISPERWKTGVDFMLVWCGELGVRAADLRDWMLSEAAAAGR